VTLRYEVEYEVNGVLLADAPASLGGPEGLVDMSMSDDVKKVLGDEKAHVGVSLTHKIGGPQYSSVGLNVYVNLTCGQDEDTVIEAQNQALSLAMEFIELNIGACYKHLLRIVDEVVT